MKSYTAELLAEQLERIATTLAQAEDVGRRKAGENLPGDLANDDRLVGIFVQRWLQGAATDAVRDVRNVARQLRPKRRRRAT